MSEAMVSPARAEVACMLVAVLLAALAVATPAPSHAADARALRALDQSMLDAWASGNKAAWEAVLAPDATYVDENGAIMNRRELLAEVVGLPPGNSGTIAMTRYDVSFYGSTAIVFHVDDEHEVFHGQKLHADYLTSETWVSRGGRWQLEFVHTAAVNRTPPPVTLTAAVTASYVGSYRAAPDYVYEIALANGALRGGIRGAKSHPLLAETNDVLFAPGQPRTRMIFERDASGKVTGFRSRREGEDVIFRRI